MSRVSPWFCFYTFDALGKIIDAHVGSEEFYLERHLINRIPLTPYFFYYSPVEQAS
jgi:hypothetical protein